MVDKNDNVFRIRRTPFFLIRLVILLVVFSTVFIPLMITTYGKPYPDLNLLLNWYSILGLLWIMLVYVSLPMTTSVDLKPDSFSVKKLGRRVKSYPYHKVLSYNERINYSRGEQFHELTVYTADDWFSIKSNEFEDYDSLKSRLTGYGQSVFYLKVLTKSQRTLFRWLIGVLILIIFGNIAFGFVVHSPANPNPARLKSVIDVVSQVHENRYKGRLKGVTISFRTHPDYSFYVARRNYDTPLTTLSSEVQVGDTLELVIRDSDYRKKLSQTDPLTLGDRYSGNSQVIEVFGVRQNDRIRLQSTQPTYEPTYTNTRLRTFLMSILLVFCWTAWVYIDKHRLLRIT